MTTRKTEEQLRKAEIVKVARAALTVKYRLQLDRELNQVLPDLEDAFDRQVQAGLLPGEVNVKALVAEGLGHGAE
jgi:hypothetical protein